MDETGGAGAFRLLYRQFSYFAGCVGIKGIDSSGNPAFIGIYGRLSGHWEHHIQTLWDEPARIYVGSNAGRCQRYGPDFSRFRGSKPGSDCFAGGTNARCHFGFPADHPSFGSFSIIKA